MARVRKDAATPSSSASALPRSGRSATTFRWRGGHSMKLGRSLIVSAFCVSLALPAPVLSQAPAPGSPQPSQAPAATKSFSQEELDQLVAPIALYPDALVAQVLMASTYPLDIVAADRWVKSNPGLKDKAL